MTSQQIPAPSVPTQAAALQQGPGVNAATGQPASLGGRSLFYQPTITAAVADLEDLENEFPGMAVPAALRLPSFVNANGVAASLTALVQHPVTEALMTMLRQPATLMAGVAVAMLLIGMWIILPPTPPTPTQATPATNAAEHRSARVRGDQTDYAAPALADPSGGAWRYTPGYAPRYYDAQGQMVPPPGAGMDPQQQAPQQEGWWFGKRFDVRTLGAAFGDSDMVEKIVSAAKQSGARANPFQQLLLQQKVEPPPEPVVDPIGDPVSATTEPVAPPPPPPDPLQGIQLKGILMDPSTGKLDSALFQAAENGVQKTYVARPGRPVTINGHRLDVQRASGDSLTLTVDGYESRMMTLESVVSVEKAKQVPNPGDGGGMPAAAGNQPGGPGGPFGQQDEPGFAPGGMGYAGPMARNRMLRQGYKVPTPHPLQTSQNPGQRTGYHILKLH